MSGPADIDADLLEAMKLEFAGDGLRPATVDDYVRMWRTFAKFCIDHGYGPDPLALTVRGPRQPRRAPDTFTEAQAATILAACGCARDRVLVQLILETGLRRSEVAALTVDDIDKRPAGWLCRVRQGKGRKDRGVPLSEDVAELLAAYMRTRPHTECRALFLTLQRTPQGDYAPLGSAGIYRVWYRLSQATGIPAHPHKGRHTAATRWAQDGISPWAIQRALGHSTLAMTNRYVDNSAVDLTAAFRRGAKRRAAATSANGTSDSDALRDALAAVAEQFGGELRVSDLLKALQRQTS